MMLFMIMHIEYHLRGTHISQLFSVVAMHAVVSMTNMELSTERALMTINDHTQLWTFFRWAKRETSTGCALACCIQLPAGWQLGNKGSLSERSALSSEAS
jgi:hypothetical protein